MASGRRSVRSLDFDADSVAATAALRERYAPAGADWSVERGDVLDGALVDRLGAFDVVYAWGMVHHTGAMWHALANASALVAPGGVLFTSVYNDQGMRSDVWRAVKRGYNRLPRPLRPAYAAGAILPSELVLGLRAAVTGELAAYVRSWRASGARGMTRWHGIVDWVGGYPFEVARPGAVVDFCGERGLRLVKLRTVGSAAGCNEFVFERVEG